MGTPETLTIQADDGHRFEMHVYTAAKIRAPVLVFFSALGTPARAYRHFASALAAQGAHVCTPEWRGIGSSSLRPSRHTTFGYRQLLEIDAPAVLAAVTQRFPGAQVWLGGHSLGGQLGTLMAASQPEDMQVPIGGLVLIASGSVYHKCYPQPLRTGIRLVGVINRLSAPLGFFPGQRIGFGGREATGVMHDWSHVAATGRYQPQGSRIDYESKLATMALPVLALNFSADAWGPAAAAEYLLAKLPACKTEHWVWDAEKTGGIRLDHFSWTRNPELLTPSLVQWMLQHRRG